VSTRLSRRTRRFETSGGHDYDTLTCPAPRERLDVRSADGTRLNVEIFGQEHGPTIVLAHGWTCSIVFWARQLNALSATHRVVAYDQRGHGSSDLPGPAGASAQAIADDLIAVLEATVPDGQKAILAGHSMGAMAMISLAGRHPERLHAKVAAALVASTGMSQLIVRSTIVPMPLPLATVFAPISARVIAASPPGGSRVNGAAKFVTKYASMSRSATRAEVDFCARIIADCRPRVRTAFGQMLSTLNIDDSVAQLNVPVVVVAGTRDRLTPLWHTRRMAERLPQLHQMIEVEGAGHMTPVQAADQVNAALAALAQAHLQTSIDLTEPASAAATAGHADVEQDIA
jgi:pimeloyl-ACP methyl ester carboxylesterase